MAFKLPPPDHQIWTTIDRQCLERWRELPGFRRALTVAREFIAEDKAVHSLQVLCLRANGEVWLIWVGPKGGWRRRWNFGSLL